MTRYRVGVDVGGTFTDVVLMDDGSGLTVKKVLSTPHDYSEAILEALEDLLREHGAEGDRIEAVIHGTTVATNALLTRTGAKTGLITTRGFRDVLEFARLRLGRLYDMDWERAAPLVPRYLRTGTPRSRPAASGSSPRSPRCPTCRASTATSTRRTACSTWARRAT